MNLATTAPVPAPSLPVALSASQVTIGVPIAPLQRLKMMSPGEWEQFILEWVDSIRSTYSDVHQCGGAGDLGRDVIGFKSGVNKQSPWDNYQCKHYAQPLAVADVVAELGKLLYHASREEFLLPDAYVFVAPHGPGTGLLKVLQKSALKEEMLKRWDTACRTKIMKGNAIELSAVQSTIDSFDFARVVVVPPLKIIAGHQTTKYHAIRFGGGLPSRVLPIPKPPTVLQPNEHIYIKKLLEAYEDEKKTSFPTVDAVQSDAPDLGKHLDRSREQFFSAESLRVFSRDNVPMGTFEQLQSEIYDGIQDVYEDHTHGSGYQRVVKTVREARNLPITGNSLVGVMHSNDRAGICHQLANDDKMTWVHNHTNEE